MLIETIHLLSVFCMPYVIRMLISAEQTKVVGRQIAGSGTVQGRITTAAGLVVQSGAKP